MMRSAKERAEIKRRLVVARAEKGISQNEVDVRARMRPGKYFRIENCYDEATPKEQRAIARVLGSQPDSLFAPVADEAVAS